MKRAGIFFTAFILLAGGVWYEKYHRVENPLVAAVVATVTTVTNRPAPVVVQDLPEESFQIEASNFSDSVDLWGDPWIKPDEVDSSYASLAFPEELHPANFEKFHPRLEYQADPLLTVSDRQLVYSLIGSSTFNLKLNFKPAFTNPDTWIPTRITPGISGSFNF